MKCLHLIATIAAIFVLMTMRSCTLAPDFSDVPELTFVNFSKNTMQQGIVNLDSLFLTISFTDGDGDISFDTGTTSDLRIYDLRTGVIYSNYRLPSLPPEGISNGLSGDITLLLYTTCCIFPDQIPPCESPDDYPTNNLPLGIILEDRAGNVSDTLKTPPITLLCE